jgi:hypothetical protein
MLTENEKLVEARAMLSQKFKLLKLSPPESETFLSDVQQAMKELADAKS